MPDAIRRHPTIYVRVTSRFSRSQCIRSICYGFGGSSSKDARDTCCNTVAACQYESNHVTITEWRGLFER
jgi:hypothetical protein